MNKLAATIALSITVLSASGLAVSLASTNVKEEILKRCHTRWDSDSVSMVLYCVKADIKAYPELQKITKNKITNPIVTRCLGKLEKYGHSTTLKCIKKNLKAEKELKKLTEAMFK